MKKLSSLHYVAMSIGIISMVVGLYSAYQGMAFQDYWLGLTMGVVLAGAAYFDSISPKKEG